VDEGADVTEGQKLLEFDSSIIDARIRVAEIQADYEVRIKQARGKYEYLTDEYRRRQEMGKFGKRAKRREAQQKMRDAELNLEELKRQRERAAAELHSLQQKARQYTIKSPIDGTVSNVKVEAGELAQLGTKLIEVVDPDLIEVPVHVPERYLQAVEAGQDATVRFTETDAGPFEGTVDAVLPVVSGSSGMVTVKVLVEVPTRDVVPGMKCDVKFEGAGRTAERAGN